MKSLLPLISLLLATTALAAEKTFDANAARKTITTSLKWLEDDMITWRTENGCAACHHGPMYLWTMHVARRQGYAVDEPRLKEVTDWLLTNDEARIFPKRQVQAAVTAKANAADKMTAAMMGHNNLSQPTIYLAHALNAMPESDPARRLAWSKLAEHLSSVQLEDGSIAGRKGWPPIFNTPQILTLFAATGMSGHLRNDPEASDSKLRSTFERASGFLARQTADETHQGLVLRLLWHAQPIPQSPTKATDQVRISRSDEEQVATLIAPLRKLQREDGGWAQTADRPSDAFATGQALYALRVAGLTTSDDSVRSALAFLMRTQQADGTWIMSSRPNPETGKPADFLNPITYAAAAWATLGMTSHVAK